jgi:hypothetical protein
MAVQESSGWWRCLGEGLKGRLGKHANALTPTTLRPQTCPACTASGLSAVPSSQHLLYRRTFAAGTMRCRTTLPSSRPPTPAACAWRSSLGAALCGWRGAATRGAGAALGSRPASMWQKGGWST